MSSETEIRPFQVEMPGEAIADLRRRVAATCWPSKELVTDASQGVQQAMLQELARYWAADYDWRRCEAELNALPLIMTHGWPGSVIEMLGVVGPLTDPTSHGGQAEDAFDLVLPSIPGYGFSGQPCVRISGSAFSCRDLTWMKWMSTPSISVVNCGSAFSSASHRRQS